MTCIHGYLPQSEGIPSLLIIPGNLTASLAHIDRGTGRYILEGMKVLLLSLLSKFLTEEYGTVHIIKNDSVIWKPLTTSRHPRCKWSSTKPKLTSGSSRNFFSRYVQPQHSSQEAFKKTSDSLNKPSKVAHKCSE